MEEDHDDSSQPLADETPPPSWIKKGIALFVVDGLQGIHYSAATKSDPFRPDGEDDAWHVTIKYDSTRETIDVECSRCIQIDADEGRGSRERKKRDLYSPNHAAQKKIKVEAPQPRRGLKHIYPPEMIDLTGSGGESSSSPSSDLSSEDTTPRSGVARMPPPEEDSSDDDHDDSPSSRGSFISSTPNKKRGPGRPRKWPLSDRRFGKSSSTKKRGSGCPARKYPLPDSVDERKRPGRPQKEPSRRKANVSQISDESLLTDESSNIDSEKSKRRTPAQRKQDEAYREKCKKQFEAAMNALTNMNFTVEESCAELEEIGPPFTKLQTAAREILRKRKEKAIAGSEERDGGHGRFEPEIGMEVRKAFDGTIYKGIVLEQDKVEKNGNLVNVWKVRYEDGDEEDFERDELLRYRYPRPVMAKCRGRPMQALELFCGRGVVSEEFRLRLWKVISLDNDENSNATLCKDILDVEPCDLEFVPDFIWASLPCHTYSRAAGGVHRSAPRGQLEKSEEARRNNFLFTKMVRFMKQAKSLHPHLIVAIENPVGQLQNMPLMKAFEDEFDLKKVQVDYCAFGRADRKPTHIWTNDDGLRDTLRDCRCEEHCCVGGPGNHESVQGNSHRQDFGVIPQPLAEEVAEQVSSKFHIDRIRRRKAADPRKLPREAAIGGNVNNSNASEDSGTSEVEEQHVAADSNPGSGSTVVQAYESPQRKQQDVVPERSESDDDDDDDDDDDMRDEDSDSDSGSDAIHADESPHCEQEDAVAPKRPDGDAQKAATGGNVTNANVSKDSGTS